MSLWKVFENARYCGGVSEHTIKRYKRIRQNRDKLIELGLISVDEPLDCYQTTEWLEHSKAYEKCEWFVINHSSKVLSFLYTTVR